MRKEMSHFHYVPLTNTFNQSKAKLQHVPKHLRVQIWNLNNSVTFNELTFELDTVFKCSP